jgi:hypothetical protein
VQPWLDIEEEEEGTSKEQQEEERKKRRRQRKKKRRPSPPVQICLAEDLRVSTPPSMNLSCDVHGNPMISRLGDEELQLGIGEKECHILVSGHTGTETFIFKYPDGKIKGGLYVVFCSPRPCDRFEWSFTQFGSAV